MSPIPPSGCGSGTKPTVWTNTLEKGTSWHLNGCDGWLATTGVAYLGHAKVTDTYWYVTATPELLELAASRFERFAEGEQP